MIVIRDLKTIKKHKKFGLKTAFANDQSADIRLCYIHMTTCIIFNYNQTIITYRIVSNKRSPSNKLPPNLFSNKTR